MSDCFRMSLRKFGCKIGSLIGNIKDFYRNFYVFLITENIRNITWIRHKFSPNIFLSYINALVLCFHDIIVKYSIFKSMSSCFPFCLPKRCCNFLCVALTV